MKTDLNITQIIYCIKGNTKKKKKTYQRPDAFKKLITWCTGSVGHSARKGTLVVKKDLGGGGRWE